MTPAPTSTAFQPRQGARDPGTCVQAIPLHVRPIQPIAEQLAGG